MRSVLAVVVLVASMLVGCHVNVEQLGPSTSYVASGCEMSRGRAEIGTSGRALLVLAAFLGLMIRRQYKKKSDAATIAALEDEPTGGAAKPKLKKLRLGRGGIVKRKRAS